MESGKQPELGVGLALSGGGFRATLFHLGSLWRLNELGWLPKLTRITSVSGGSITAGVLGYRWKRLNFDDSGIATNFIEEIAVPDLPPGTSPLSKLDLGPFEVHSMV